MKIFVFEPYGVRTGTGVNTSERFNTIMNQLAGYSPTELRLNDISSDEIKTEWLEKNDNSETIIIAHYTDVEGHFNELETVNNAICLFHTYKTTWYKDAINTDNDVIKIMNDINRFCIDSETLKGKLDAFVQNVVEGKTAKLSFDVFIDYDPKFEELLSPFAKANPTKSIGSLKTAKKNLCLHLKSKGIVDKCE